MAVDKISRWEHENGFVEVETGPGPNRCGDCDSDFGRQGEGRFGEREGSSLDPRRLRPHTPRSRIRHHVALLCSSSSRRADQAGRGCAWQPNKYPPKSRRRSSIWRDRLILFRGWHSFDGIEQNGFSSLSIFQMTLLGDENMFTVANISRDTVYSNTGGSMLMLKREKMFTKGLEFWSSLIYRNLLQICKSCQSIQYKTLFVYNYMQPKVQRLFLPLLSSAATICFVPPCLKLPPCMCRFLKK